MSCAGCGRTFLQDEILYTCPDCGPLAGTLDAVYDTAALSRALSPAALASRREPTLWRYRELLPIRDAAAIPPVPVGMTPLVPLPAALRASVAPAGADARIWIKDDTRHPSGSAKDRATVVALARARELGYATVAAASTGNAASSLATLAAAAGFSCVIFAPAAAPEAKLIQIRIHGARLFALKGTYDEAFDLCAELCARTAFEAGGAPRLYSRNTATNPVLGEGKKTIALEIFEQLGCRAPEAVVVPAGDGCILGGVAKGFSDLTALGWIERPPRLIGVQAEGSAALARAWRAGEDTCRPVEARTLADSIAVALPRDQVKALRAVRRSGGAFVTVSDAAIIDSLRLLAARGGLFVEPAAAAAFAGLRQAWSEGVIDADEETVVVLTGHGLKDIAAARRAAEGNAPVEIAPGPRAVDEVGRWLRV